MWTRKKLWPIWKFIVKFILRFSFLLCKLIFVSLRPYYIYAVLKHWFSSSSNILCDHFWNSFQSIPISHAMNAWVCDSECVLQSDSTRKIVCIKGEWIENWWQIWICYLPDGDKDHGKNQIFPQQWNDQWRWGNYFNNQQKEHMETNQNRYRKRDLFIRSYRNKIMIKQNKFNLIEWGEVEKTVVTNVMVALSACMCIFQ